ncbi:DUF4260 family protein [Streptomyces sp. P6-2-1]|uniref:DUF4260 family protein n=1 Tax=unclassified Streptomyces TaxID=2593676 RepID=UPI003D36F7BA
MTATLRTAAAPTRSRTFLLRRLAWGAAALFWLAFTVLEGVDHGWLVGLVAFAGLIAPDLTMLVGAREAAGLEHGQLPPRAVPYYNAAHRALVPLALLTAYAFGPWHAPAFFALLCGWLAHITADRAFGYGLRTEEGFRRG